MGALKARPGLVNNKSGKSFDYAREAATEAGFGPFNDVREFLEAVHEEALGRKVYRPHEQHQADLLARTDRESDANERHYSDARNRVVSEEEDAGLRLTPAEVEHATQMHMDGATPGEAIRSAVTASEYEILDREAQRNAFSGDGVSPAATQSNMLETPWNAEAAARDRTAQAGWAEHFSTFKNAPGVGDILRPGATSGEFRVPLSRVPSTILGGVKQAEKVQAYLKAGGDRQALLDYAAFDLRRNAERADGTLDTTKAGNWLKNHAEAATVLPELRTLGDEATTASRAYEAAVTKRIAERTAFEKSVAGKFLGDVPPERVIANVLDSDTREAGMSQLARLTAGNPAARAGLQNLTINHLIEVAKSNALAGATDTQVIKSDLFQNRLRKYEGAMGKILSPEQLTAFKDVARDLQRQNLSVTETKLAGRSNTASDVHAMSKAAGAEEPSVARQLVTMEVTKSLAEGALKLGGHGDGIIGKIVGGAAGIGTVVMREMRQHGLNKVNDILTEATLHPGLMKTLLMRPGPKAAPSVLAILKRQLTTLSASAAAQNVLRPNKESRR